MGRTILFDLDGTITDSGEGIINCATLALEHFGLPIPNKNAMRVFVGPPQRTKSYCHYTSLSFGLSIVLHRILSLRAFAGSVYRNNQGQDG